MELFSPINRVGSGGSGGGSGGGTPGGSDTYIQFNDSNVFGGDEGLIYDKTNDLLTISHSGVLTSPPGNFGLLIKNPTEATSGSPNIYSPPLTFLGSAWDSDDSVAREMKMSIALTTVGNAPSPGRFLSFFGHDRGPVKTVTIASSGSGYTLYDFIQLVAPAGEGNGLTLRVMGVDGTGGVTDVSIISIGGGYVVGGPYNCEYGTGSGLTINITAIITHLARISSGLTLAINPDDSNYYGTLAAGALNIAKNIQFGPHIQFKNDLGYFYLRYCRGADSEWGGSPPAPDNTLALINGSDQCIVYFDNTDLSSTFLGDVDVTGTLSTSGGEVAYGGGSTGAGTTPNGTVTLIINGVSYYLLTSSSA